MQLAIYCLVTIVLAAAVTWVIFRIGRAYGRTKLQKALGEYEEKMVWKDSPIAKETMELVRQVAATRGIESRIGWAKPHALVLMAAANALKLMIEGDAMLAATDADLREKRREIYETYIDRLVVFERTNYGEELDVLNGIHDRLSDLINKKCASGVKKTAPTQSVPSAS